MTIDEELDRFRRGELDDVASIARVLRDGVEPRH
jgi:hypothetical protein